ncbi:Hypothetical protein AA314_09206 [Archangium gephyra]|uniref:Uncharacterized protein n=1 Tax=Archangium gephyra TaxID=48 RepID=A0AAC8QI83_9BACT|nr:Hypothetical protein AA314_09206 [Archangium gephyra]
MKNTASHPDPKHGGGPSPEREVARPRSEPFRPTGRLA